MEAELSRKSQSSRYRVPSLKTTVYPNNKESKGEGSAGGPMCRARKPNHGGSIDDEDGGRMASTPHSEKRGKRELQ